MINFRFREIQTAQEFGIKINEWDILSKEARAEMMAFTQIENEIELYQMPESPKEKD